MRLNLIHRNTVKFEKTLCKSTNFKFPGIKFKKMTD